MTHQSTVARAAASRLEPNAISVAQDTLIGLADTGPTVSISFSLVVADCRHRVRRTAGPADYRDSDADHRERLPAAEPVERELRRVL